MIDTLANNTLKCEVIGEHTMKMLNETKIPPAYAIACTGSTFVSVVSSALGPEIADGLLKIIHEYLDQHTEQSK